MNELQDNALFCSGFLIVLLFGFFPHIYAFFGIQTLPVLFLESINWFWRSKKFQFSSCLLDYHQNKVRPSNSKQTADKKNQRIIFLECESQHVKVIKNESKTKGSVFITHFNEITNNYPQKYLSIH